MTLRSTLAQGEPLLRATSSERICSNFVADPMLLFFGEIGIHWQRHDLSGKPLRHGEVSFFISQVPVGFLEMQRDRVVNACADVVRSQLGHEIVAIFHPNYI